MPGSEREMAANATLPLTATGGKRSHNRLRMLDGWRAISILAVLAGHMLPLGPAQWGMNGDIAANGMAIFFTLSGFLIVGILHRDQNIASFLIRRFVRIIPLAWTAMAVALAIKQVDASVWAANLLFYANLPPFWLIDWASHYWSLDLEMQFYASIALAVLAMGRGGLRVLPIAAIAVTGLRIWTGSEISIVTWLRVDEILAGGLLAMVIYGDPQSRAQRMLRQIPFWPITILALLSTRQELSWLNYARPYLTATMVGITIVRPIQWLTPLLESRPAAYLAQISYAVYIIHHFTLFGWLGSGEGLTKYIKRPLCFAISFSLAHLSTFYFEKPFNDWAHRFTRRRPVGQNAD